MNQKYLQSPSSSYHTLQPCKPSVEKLDSDQFATPAASLSRDAEPVSPEEVAATAQKHKESVDEQLREQRAQYLADGYMLPEADFHHLHYEDPLVTELKNTHVSECGM